MGFYSCEGLNGIFAERNCLGNSNVMLHFSAKTLAIPKEAQTLTAQLTLR